MEYKWPLTSDIKTSFVPKIQWGTNKPQQSCDQHISASSKRNLKIKDRTKALEKMKNMPPSASKSIKRFGHKKDLNGEGSNGTCEISFILDQFYRLQSWYLVEEKTE